MKKTISSALALTMAVLMLVSLVACSKPRDTELGEGAKTVKVEVKAGEKSVIFTIKTDKAVLGDALIEHGLIEGDQGQYGLYIKKVNGITADYDVDKHYWGFYKNGEYMMTGVDGTEFADNDSYELVYSE